MRRYFALLIVVVAVATTLAQPAFAAVGATKASGGSAISADDAATGALTSLSGPVLTEAVGGDIGAGSVVLATPEGFAFGSETVTVAAAPVTTAMRLSASATCDTQGRVISITPTSSRITVYVCEASSVDAPGSLTFSGVAVRPTAGTPLAAGELHLHDTSTAQLAGLTRGSTGTGLGELVEVAGAVATVQVTPGAVQLPVKAQQQFTATQADQFGNPSSETVTWTTAAGAVDGDGLFTAGSRAGSYPSGVTATVGEVSDSADITLVASELDSIVLTADADSVAAGDVVRYSVSGSDAYGNEVSDFEADLAITDHDGQAVPNATCDAAAFTCSAAGAGSYLVTARAGDAFDTHSLTVVQGAIERISVSPKDVEITAEEDAFFTVTGYDAYGNGSIIEDAALSLTASDGGAHDGVCEASRCSATRATTYTVTATAGQLQDAATLVVTPGKLTSLELIASAGTAVAGTEVTYAARGADAYGNAISDAQPELSIADAHGGTDGAACAGQTCMSERTGVFTVTGRVDDVAATAALEVTPAAPDRIILAPLSPTVFGGESLQFTASVIDVFGNLRSDAVTWSALDAVGTIDATGRLTSRDAASHYADAVTATSGALTASTDVAVTLGEIVRLAMSPQEATISAGAAHQYAFVAYDQYGTGHDRVVPDLAIVDAGSGAPVDGASCDAATRSCTATRAGNYIVTATSGDAVATAGLTVVPGALAGVTVTPDFSSRRPLASTGIDARPVDAFGNAIPGHQVSFAITKRGSGVGPVQPSLQRGTADSDGNGVARVWYTAGVAPGQDEITATVGGFTATTVITVGL